MDSPRFRDLGGRLRGQTPSSRRYPPNDWTIEESERRLVDEAVEWAVVFDQSERQLFRQRGTRQTISFFADDLPLLRDAIVVHNHPLEEGERGEDLTLSLLDLVFAVRFDVAEMRVVTSGWHFVLRRPDDGWPADETIVSEVYTETLVLVRTEFDQAIREGTMTAAQALRLENDETLRRVAVWGHFVYHKEAIL